MIPALDGNFSACGYRRSPDVRSSYLALPVLIVLACGAQAFCGEIHNAARDGDLAKIQALLKANPGAVSSRDNDGETPLHYAAGFGRKDVAELLLAHRAVVDAKDNDGWTPLHFAAQQGHADLAELLLAHNADVNAKNNDGDTPLHMAGGQGYKKLAELLLAHKAAVDAQDKEGWTPMQIAVGNGHNDVVELLRQHGGHDSRPVGEVATTIDTTIREANQRGNLAVLQALVKDMPYMVLTKDSDGRTPLHLAAGSGFTEVAEFWLANKAEVNAKDNSGKTPLHLAVFGDYKGVVELLLAHGASVDPKDNTGMTPLHLAAYRGFSGYLDVAELLLVHKAAVNAKTKGGWTALHYAAFNGNKEMAELLLARGADVNARDDAGETPLYEAAKVGSKDLAKLLIAHNADINAADNGGKTPSRVAIVNNRQDVADLLLAHGAVSRARQESSSTPSHTDLGPTTVYRAENQKHDQLPSGQFKAAVAQPVKWLAAGNTALAITGDIKLAPDKITIRNKDYPLTLVREIDARHLKDVAIIMSDQPIAARLYRTKIQKDEKFNSFGNSACDDADANWLLIDNARDPYTGKPQLGLAFFSGESEPELDYKVISAKAGLLCGTFGYSQ